jgi:pimeloyl-ACP methyl ester carboxylesterase
MENRSAKGRLQGAILYAVIIPLLIIVLMGCVVGHGPSPKKPNSVHEITLFSYEKEKIQPQVQPLREENTFRVERVAFPSSMAPHWVTAYHYVQRSRENPPTIIILPILGANYFFSKNCARYLARRGFSCLRFERTVNPLEPQKGLVHTEMVLRHAIIDIRRAIDWLGQRGGGNSDHIGIAGISMGAIVAALALEVEPRINSAAILLGGGDIATILATSRENLVVRFREGIMRAKGYGLEQFHEEATQVLAPVDPLTYASRGNPKSILMVNARFDKVIPSPCSQKLWEALGRPLWIRIPTGHDSSALFLWYIRYRVLKHFRKVLAEEG